jgi:hypothetical protein
MDFTQFKKRRQSNLGSLTEKLLKDATSQNKASYSDDPNEFKLQKDKSGNGRAIIRFLPHPAGPDVLPYVRLYTHGFEVNKKWLIENCPTTIKGERCPICEANVELYDTGIESNKSIARNRKRKLSYYANIYVVSNPSDPSIEGTVKIFRFGQKILDKIISAMKPEFEGDETIEPFCLWKGANFRLISKNIKTDIGGKTIDMPNYDDSKFEAKSAFLNGDDDLLEEIFDQLHPLDDIVDPSKFKSYDELEKKLNFVINSRPKPVTTSQEDQEKELDNLLSENTDIMSELESSYKTSKEKSMEDDEDDEDLRRFMALADS